MSFKEYEDVFNMTIKDRRDYLKDKPDEYKKKYFQYDNKERSRLYRLKNNTKKTDDNSSNITHISQDPLLNSNPELFKQKIDDMFKEAKQEAIINNSNIDIVSEVLNNPVNIQQDINNQPIQAPIQIPKEEPIQIPIQIPKEEPIQIPIQAPKEEPKEEPIQIPIQIPIQSPKEEPKEEPIQIPKEEPNDIIDFNEKDVFYRKVVYADLIVAKDFCYENVDNCENINPDTIKEIKNYNIKIPIEYLSEVFIKMPINSKSRMICDTENMYIFF